MPDRRGDDIFRTITSYWRDTTKYGPFEEAWVHGTKPVPVATASDEDLLVAAARRDPDAVAALHERHVDPIYRFCLRRLGDRDAAEDATAQVFTKAIVTTRRLIDDARPRSRWPNQPTARRRA